jgi:hypothetical protein
MTTVADKNEEIAHALRAGTITPVEAARLLEGAKAKVRIAGQFAPGAKVTLFHVAYAQQLAASGEEVATATVDKDGVVEFSGDDIDVGRHYRAIGENYEGETRELQASAKVPPADPPQEMPVLQDDPVPEPETKQQAKEIKERAERVTQAKAKAPDGPDVTQDVKALAGDKKKK